VRSLEHWRIALGALRANWFRAILTALGVVIGVASLLAVSAVSAGAQAGVAKNLRLLGANVVVVDGEFITIGTTQTATDRVMTPADAVAIGNGGGIGRSVFGIDAAPVAVRVPGQAVHQVIVAASVQSAGRGYDAAKRETVRWDFGGSVHRSTPSVGLSPSSGAFADRSSRRESAPS